MQGERPRPVGRGRSPLFWQGWYPCTPCDVGAFMGKPEGPWHAGENEAPRARARWRAGTGRRDFQRIRRPPRARAHLAGLTRGDRGREIRRGVGDGRKGYGAFFYIYAGIRAVDKAPFGVIIRSSRRKGGGRREARRPVEALYVPNCYRREFFCPSYGRSAVSSRAALFAFGPGPGAGSHLRRGSFVNAGVPPGGSSRWKSRFFTAPACAETI